MGRLLEVKDLYVEFKNKDFNTYAVNGVNFDLFEGENLGIVGESGSGKSVTAKSIMQLIDRENIKKGQIYFEGVDLLKEDEKELRKLRGNSISMVFQDPMTSLNPLFTIGTQMRRLIKRHRKSMSKKEIEDLSIEWLNAVGISGGKERLRNYPHEFSGGMRQRVMIAMALCLNPKLVIADEPTTALDVTIQAQVLDLLNNLSQEKERSIILITHDLGVVANTCDRVLVMYGGMIMESADVEELFNNPKHPYTKGLLKSLPKKASRERLTPIKGNPPNMTKKPDACPFADRCDYSIDICFKEIPKDIEISTEHIAKCHLLEEDKND